MSFWSSFGFSPYSLCSRSKESWTVPQKCHVLLHGTHSTRLVSEVTQSCPTLCHPMNCSPPGSSIHGILQARILKWVAISFSRGSSWPRDRTQVSRIAGRHFNLWATRAFNKIRMSFSSSPPSHGLYLQRFGLSLTVTISKRLCLTFRIWISNLFVWLPTLSHAIVISITLSFFSRL